MKKKIRFGILAITLSIVAYSTQISAQTANFVSVDDAAKAALNIGAKAPSFSLKDSTGKLVSSKNLLKEGNMVLVFYRGSWCPFCNTYLHKLQTRLTDITAAGGKVVAVSVENPDASMAIAKKNEVLFTVLSDTNLDVARKFNIVYQLPPETDAKYKTYGIDLANHNAMEKAELPLSATYIINKKGKIVYAFLEPDYKKRAEPDVIIDVLKKLK
ncbi:MAG: peroxiredoxin-like family protein [Pyrinomonadaceae bacterium]